MPRSKHYILFLICIALSSIAALAQQIYDELADAPKDIRAAIAKASVSKPRKNVVLEFGANWCRDCHALDGQMHQPELAALIDRHFVLVKIDVGRMNRNLGVASRYHVPVENGIPALAVLDSKGKLLFAQDQGQFADARHMSFESIKAFFEKWKPRE